jgi:hypothetical protein
MELANILFGLMNTFLSFILICISIPLVKGHVSMNNFYGIRFKKSYESNENWTKINKYGGRQLIIWSIPLGIFGIASFFLPVSNSPMLYLISILAPFIVLIPCVMSYLYARKL